MTFNYQTWLKPAQDRLEQLYRQRGAIDEEIAGLKRGIEGFSQLAKRNPPWLGESAGITEAIKQVLQSEPARLYSPTVLRDELLSRGVKLTQRNPMATIHQILARLLQRGLIKPFDTDGRTLYKWNDESPTSSGDPLPVRQKNARGKMQY